MESIKKFEPLWGVWKCESVLGEGGFGRVYKAVRNDGPHAYYSAIKHISVPANEQQLQDVRTSGMYRSDKEVSEYFSDIVMEVQREIDFMYTLRGNANIVSYEDHMVIPKEDGIGCDIFIRMELLEGLNSIISTRDLTEAEAAKIGTDICTALETCSKAKIIHRDIKPSNIFVNPNGDYKLGDFGIARVLGGTTTGVSKKGTLSYMAPEIYKLEPANFTSDIYSLGVVLYRILNDNRLPFLPLTGIVRSQDQEAALIKMVSGAPMPPPKNASPQLAAVILKACANNKRDRFQSASEFKKALNDAVEGNFDAGCIVLSSAVITSEVSDPTEVNVDATQVTQITQVTEVNSDSSVQDAPAKEKKKKKKKGLVFLLIAAMLAIAFGVGSYLGYIPLFDKSPVDSTKQTSAVSTAPTENEDTEKTTEKTTESTTTTTAATTTTTKKTAKAEFSDWVTKLPSGVNSQNYIIEKKTQYKYRDKVTKTSDKSSLSGWTLDSKKVTGYTAWGSWSSWSKTSVTKTDTRDVQTREIAATYKTKYKYYGYRGTSSNGNRYHWCLTCAKTNLSNYSSYSWDKFSKTYDSKLSSKSGSKCSHSNSYGTGTTYYVNKDTGPFFYKMEEIKEQQTEAYTEYSYRTRSEVYTYYYSKWGDWSSYSFTKRTKSDTRDVQTRTVYRYKKK